MRDNYLCTGLGDDFGSLLSRHILFVCVSIMAAVNYPFGHFPSTAVTSIPDAGTSVSRLDIQYVYITNR